MPIKIIVGKIKKRGARFTTEIINLSKYPVFSATPMPIITASTKPNAGNSEKFFMASFIIIAEPSWLKIFLTWIV
ncbi:Uncharacterised protein [Staphylococcus aureus]|nr:Uncharacterised protein [Staphylococcus aureus]